MSQSPLFSKVTEPLRDQVVESLGEFADSFYVDQIMTNLAHAHPDLEHIDHLAQGEYWGIVLASVLVAR